MAGGYLLVSRGSVGTSGVVIIAAALEKRETGGWIWRQRKRGYGRVGTNRGCRRAPLLPRRRVSQLQLPPPGAGHRRVTGHRAPPSSLPPRLLASRRFASPRKREEEKEEGDDVDYADMWGPRGSHADSAVT
uniref:Uncharacterized protein n=1 Tax=Oryza barthii TaxID=65489 RepID=A0A0D3EMW1_9ORYZ